MPQVMERLVRDDYPFKTTWLQPLYQPEPFK